MVKKILLATAILGISVFSLQAEETELKTKTNLNYMSSAGNSDITNMGITSELSKKIDKNEFSGKVDWYYSEESNIETKNKFTANLTYNYQINEKLFFDYLVQYEQDKFSSFDYKVFTGPGVKYKVLKEEKQTLDTGANILYERDKLKVGGSNDYVALKLNEKYKYNFTKEISFNHDFEIRTQLDEMDNYNITTNFGLSNKLNQYLAFGVNYKIDYTNKVLPGIKNTDRILTANLTINY